MDVCEELVFQSPDEGSGKVGGLITFPGELVKSSMLFRRLMLDLWRAASLSHFVCCVRVEESKRARRVLASWYWLDELEGYSLAWIREDGGEGEER